MTIIADWGDLEPNTVIVRKGHKMTLTTPDDVRRFADVLAKPDTSEGHLVHTGRPKHYNTLFDELEDDNQVFVGTVDGFWYMEYFDSDHWSQPVGDPASPEWHTIRQGYFYAGSGVPLDTFVEALSEFLVTAERPTCVDWRECD